jgi:3-methyladenine DNA glycosylase AlkD
MRLQSLGDPEVAAHAQRFFKTGPGEYGAGDLFIGLRVPVVRKLAARYRDLPLNEVRQVLHSPLHEERLCALIILTLKYPRADEAGKKALVDFYLANIQYINNWDLVDCSAHKILGPWLLHRERSVLYELADSASLWERRIAVMATFHFIRHGGYQDTLALSRALLEDPEDLVHKVTGWMLREVGKRDIDTLKDFLDRFTARMPRTMLRYAIEKLPPDMRQDYLARSP